MSAKVRRHSIDLENLLIEQARERGAGYAVLLGASIRERMTLFNLLQIKVLFTQVPKEEALHLLDALIYASINNSAITLATTASIMNVSVKTAHNVYRAAEEVAEMQGF